jgi:hypothetical protein
MFLRNNSMPIQSALQPATAKTLIIILLTSLLWGCLETYAPGSYPANLQASQLEEDKIILTWETVNFAGGYTVYRSLTQDGDFVFIGLTGVTGFVDIDVEPELSYWYAVGVLPYSGDVAREMRTPAVEGTSTHVFGWSRSSLGNGAENMDIAIDRNNPGHIYAASSGSGETQISVDFYNGTNWTGFGIDVGTIDSTGDGLFSIASLSETVYVVYSDRSGNGKLSIESRIAGEETTWQQVGSAALGSAPTGTAQIVVTDDESLYVASRTGTSEDPSYDIQVFRFDNDVWNEIPIGLPVAYNPGQIRLVTDGTKPYIFLEDVTSGSRSDVRVYSYDPQSGWTEGESLVRASGNAFIQGAFAADVYAGDYSISFVDSQTGTQAFSYHGSEWVDLLFPQDGDLLTGAIGVAIESDTTYVFYRDDETLTGNIQIHTDSWIALPYGDEDEAVTSPLDVTHLEIKVLHNRLYAAFIDGSGFGGSSFQVAIYQ